MSSLKRFVGQHPRFAAWVVLAVGMVAILIWSAREVGLTMGQWAALVVATVGLAGLCVWIIGWEDGDGADTSESSEGDETGLAA